MFASVYTFFSFWWNSWEKNVTKLDWIWFQMTQRDAHSMTNNWRWKIYISFKLTLDIMQCQQSHQKLLTYQEICHTSCNHKIDDGNRREREKHISVIWYESSLLHYLICSWCVCVWMNELYKTTHTHNTSFLLFCCFVYPSFMRVL